MIKSEYHNAYEGYWWLHVNGTLQYQGKTCHGVDPHLFFKDSWHILDWWKIECELDWYRMKKEADILREGPVEPITA